MKKIMALALAGFVAMTVVGCGDDDDDNKTPSDGTGTGPGAALKCTSSGKNAYETYGTAAFAAVNKSIIANTVAKINDPKLGPSFANSAANGQLKNDAAGFEKNLADFLIFAYGGPNNYKGRTMEASHTGLAITSDQYTYFVTDIIVPALTSNGVPQGDVESCFAPVVLDAGFIATIVNK